MPEIQNVVADTTIESEWGNAVRDRTLQRYADVTERTAENTSPSPGDLAYIENTGDVDIFHAGLWRHLGSQVGTMQMLAGGAVPIGWLLCNGALVSRTTYANLFAQIGTTWGEGDGSTTFALPDMRGRVPRGVAAATPGSEVGEKFGADTHAHAGPSHTHTNPSTAVNTHHHTHFVTANNGTPVQGAIHSPSSGGMAFVYGAPTAAQATSWHVHDQLHSHGFNDPTSDDSHSHTQPATGASGTQTSGPASTIQAGAAVNFIIKS
jgi:microcystin-dependent protein